MEDNEREQPCSGGRWRREKSPFEWWQRVSFEPWGDWTGRRKAPMGTQPSEATENQSHNVLLQSDISVICRWCCSAWDLTSALARASWRAAGNSSSCDCRNTFFDLEKVGIYVAHPGSSTRSKSVLPQGFLESFFTASQTMPENRERYNNCRLQSSPILLVFEADPLGRVLHQRPAQGVPVAEDQRGSLTHHPSPTMPVKRGTTGR